MVIENNKYETPKQHVVGDPASDSATAQNILQSGAEVRGQAEKSVGDVYDKTSQAVGESYEQAKIYSRKNPGKTILITLGIGVGLGFLFGASCRHSRTGRIARPVVNALSDIALKFFR
jgi:ElaB/YqjD/DUF883 family membrane-anchored ribosome-binding protein